MMFGLLKKFAFGFLISTLFLPLHAQAAPAATAVMSVTTSATTVKAGGTFNATILVDGKGSQFTTFQSSVSLKNLTIVEVSHGPVSKWLVPPSTSSLNFFGGVQGAISQITVLTATLRAGNATSGSITLSAGNVYWSDGSSVVNILASQKGATITITDSGTGRAIDPGDSGSAVGGDSTGGSTDNTGTGATTTPDVGVAKITNETPGNTTTFSDEVVDPTQSAVSLSKETVIADNDDSTCVSITPKNAAGAIVNPVLEFNYPGDSSATPLVSSEGIWKTCIFSAAPGTKTLEIFANGVSLKSLTVTFVAPDSEEAKEIVAQKNPGSIDQVRLTNIPGIFRYQNIILGQKLSLSGQGPAGISFILSTSGINKEIAISKDGTWQVDLGKPFFGRYKVNISKGESSATLAEFVFISEYLFYSSIAVLLLLIILIIAISKRGAKKANLPSTQALPGSQVGLAGGQHPVTAMAAPPVAASTLVVPLNTEASKPLPAQPSTVSVPQMGVSAENNAPSNLPTQNSSTAYTQQNPSYRQAPANTRYIDNIGPRR